MKSFPQPGEVLYHIFARLIRPLEAVAFWSAIALPFLHLPLLIRGLETSGELITFFTLLTLNGIAILVGHPYKRE